MSEPELPYLPGCTCSSCSQHQENNNKEEGNMSEAITEMTQQDRPVDERYTKLKENILVENGTVKVRINGNWQMAAIGSLSMATEVDSLSDWQITALEELLEANKVIERHYRMRNEAQRATQKLREDVKYEVEQMWEGHSSHMNIDDVNAALDRLGLDGLARGYEGSGYITVRRQIPAIRVESSDEDSARDEIFNEIQDTLSYGEELVYDDCDVEVEEV